MLTENEKLDAIRDKLDVIHADIKAATPEPKCAWDQRVRTPMGDGVVTKRAGCVGVNLDDSNQPECFFDADSVKPIPEDELHDEAEEVPPVATHCEHATTTHYYSHDAYNPSTALCGYNKDRPPTVTCKGRRERGDCPLPDVGKLVSEQPTEETDKSVTVSPAIDGGDPSSIPVMEGGDRSDWPAEQPKPEAKPLEWEDLSDCYLAYSSVWLAQVGGGYPYTITPNQPGRNLWKAKFTGTVLCTGSLQRCKDVCANHERKGQ